MLTTLNLPGRHLHTFGRWNGHNVGRNAATAGSRGGSDSAHLRKVGRKCGKTAHLRKVERAWWREKRSYSRLSSDSAHLRKVGRKCGKTAHLRKVERAQCREKRSYSRLSWRFSFCAPSEGEMKTRGNCTPSEGGTGMVEGETRLQQAFVGAPILRTFGR